MALKLPSWLSPKREEQRLDPSISLSDWLSYFNYNGLQYPFALSQTIQGDREDIPQSFEGAVQVAYKSNGVVFACMAARMLLFSEARFQYRRLVRGRPGDLFGTADLDILEEPWPGATTGDLLSRAIQDVDIGGNFYAVRLGNRIKRLRPDWVTILMGSDAGPDPGVAQGGDLDAEVIGYVYHPGGHNSGRPEITLTPDRVAHFAPIPDPIAAYRGMSWLTPVMREILSDSAATTHKMKYFENGATPNLIVSLDPTIQEEAFNRWIKNFDQQHVGVLNAYKTLYLGGGAEAKVVGNDLHQMDFKNVQGSGETRIAAAAGIPPIIVGLSEGLQAGSYNNYGQAVRRFADGTMRPLWRNIAGSLQRIVPAPSGAQLWYDDRDISFLKEDLKDAAEIQQIHAATIQSLINSGFEPDTAIEAVTAGDMSRLSHTGLVSVQLLPPGTAAVPAVGGPIPDATTPALPPKAPANGNNPQQPARLALLNHLEARNG